MNYTNKLQVIYRILLDTYADDKFIIKLSSQDVFQSSLYNFLEPYTKNDVNNINNNMINLEGSILLIDGEEFKFENPEELLTEAIPNLDEAFKRKMVDNMNLISDEIRQLAAIEELDQKKIIEYLDSHYKKNLNIDFLKQFNKIDAATVSQLELLKKDQTNDSIIQEIITDFYPMYIEIKTQELIANTISVKELLLFKSDL